MRGRIVRDAQSNVRGHEYARKEAAIHAPDGLDRVRGRSREQTGQAAGETGGGDPLDSRAAGGHADGP